MADIDAKKLSGELATAFHLLANPGLEGLGFDLLRLLHRIVLLTQLI